MSGMNRREFIGRAVAAVGATVAGGLTGQGSRAVAEQTATPRAGSAILRAGDTVILGRTGIQTSRLAIGTGTMVWRQREMGQRGMLKLWRHALDHGVRWWEVADMYGTHPLVRATLRQVPREHVVITTKTLSRDADGVRADIERFRRELGVDCIDIVLLHCLTDGDWTRTMRGPMDVLSEAKAKGHIRAVGCSCHTFEALTAARDEPWGDVQLARLNRYALLMDIKKPEEVPLVVDVLDKMHASGKGVYGMKILGEGRIQGDRIDDSLRFTLAQTCLDGFVIGFRSIEEFDDIVRRIERVQATA